MTADSQKAAHLLADRAHEVARVEGRERWREVLQWVSRRRLGRRRGWTPVPELDSPWQDTVSAEREGWRQRAANLDGEFAFSVDYRLCQHCRLGWVEQPYTLPDTAAWASARAAGSCGGTSVTNRPDGDPYLGHMVDEGEPRLLVNRWGDTSDPACVGRRGSYRDECVCFDQVKPHPRARVGFHAERQDTSTAGWWRLLELIDEAAEDGREEFRPLVELSAEERRQVVTLPASIAKLTAVKHFVLYGSNLVRIPPEIGAMTSLEELTPYTSYRLHWFPYAITRCAQLVRSTVSTRALFGNYKLRPPFPRLRPPQASGADLDLSALDARRWGATAIRGCSVCDRPIEQGGLQQVWISLRVATDVLPLLVNACSAACVSALPFGAEDYVQLPHTGGRVKQPPSDWD